MKKVLFMVFSCKEKPYKSMEPVIRETWGARVSRYDGTRLVFLYETVGRTRIEGDRLLVHCKTGVYNTYRKFYNGLAMAYTEYPDWDYLVRLNTSTWCNVDAVLQFLETHDGPLYPGQVTYENDFFWMQGNAYVMSREAVKAVLQKGVDFLFPETGTYTDEGGVSCALLSHCGDWLRHVKTVGVAYEYLPEPESISEDAVKNYMFIQVKNFRNGGYCFRDTEPDKMRRVQELWDSVGKQRLFKVLCAVEDNLDTQYSCFEKYIRKNDFAESGWWHTQADSFCNKEEFREIVL